MQARETNARRAEDRKRSVLVLAQRFLLEHNMPDSARALEREGGVPLKTFDAADNASLTHVLAEWEALHEERFGFRPKLTRRADDPKPGSSAAALAATKGKAGAKAGAERRAARIAAEREASRAGIMGTNIDEARASTSAATGDVLPSDFDVPPGHPSLRRYASDGVAKPAGGTTLSNAMDYVAKRDAERRGDLAPSGTEHLGKTHSETHLDAGGYRGFMNGHQSKHETRLNGVGEGTPGDAEGGAESNDDEIELARLPEYRDDGEYSDGGSFYPFEEDPYYESYDDEEDAYDDEGERRGANKGIINAAFRRMFRKGKKGTEDSPSVTPAQGRSPDESFNAAIVPIEDGVKGVKLFDGDEAVDTRSAVNSTPASPNPFETSVEDNGSRGGSGRASPSMMSPMRLLSPLGSNKVEPTNVVDVQRNDRERRRREKKEMKEKKESRKGEREKIARQPRDFGATATGADPGVYEQTPEPIQPPAPRANPMIFGGGSALGGGGSIAGTVPAKRNWYKELHSAEDTPEADRKDRG